MSLNPSWISRERELLIEEADKVTSALLDGRAARSREHADLLDLSSNENALGASPKARAAVTSVLSQLNLYPLVSSPLLREKLSRHLGVSVAEVVVGTGATGLLGMIALAALSAGETAIYSQSSLFAYRQSVIAVGGVPIEIPLTIDYNHDLDAIRDSARRGAKLVLLSNPHNPTGTVFDHSRFERFVREMPADVLVVLDEAYREFVVHPESLPRSIEIARTFPNVLLLRTFSKVYGLASARVGYAVGTSRCVAAIQAMSFAMNPGGIGVLSEAAAIAALDDADHVRDSVDHVANERKRAYQVLTSLRLEYLDSNANFVMVRGGRRTAALTSYLRASGILITSGERFGYPEWFRFSLQATRDMSRFYNCLATFFSDATEADDHVGK